jgi:hypothetical protein
MQPAQAGNVGDRLDIEDERRSHHCRPRAALQPGNTPVDK